MKGHKEYAFTQNKTTIEPSKKDKGKQIKSILSIYITFPYYDFRIRPNYSCESSALLIENIIEKFIFLD